uniref:ATP synthase mitochondrial F1 complex assembly factor 2 n=1 Tax=Parascaris univalens TaxID=6257 RepID=A0A915C9P3_PARUN
MIAGLREMTNSGYRWLMRRFMASASAITKRSKFYKNASVIPVPASSSSTPLYNVYLDDRKLKTPSGKALEIESEALALAIAQEWNNQKKYLNISHMRLSGLLFTAVDNPYSIKKEDIVSKILEYLDGDTILFRTNENEKLAAIQEQKWDPIVEWANAEFELTLKPSYSIVEGPNIEAESRNRLQRYLLAYGFLPLTGMQYAVESVKSLLLTLSVMRHRTDIEDAVDMALLEQTFQSRIWGNVEWAHDVEREELISRLSAGILFAHLTSSSSIRRPLESK